MCRCIGRDFVVAFARVTCTVVEAGVFEKCRHTGLADVVADVLGWSIECCRAGVGGERYWRRMGRLVVGAVGRSHTVVRFAVAGDETHLHIGCYPAVAGGAWYWCIDYCPAVLAEVDSCTAQRFAVVGDADHRYSPVEELAAASVMGH